MAIKMEQASCHDRQLQLSKSISTQIKVVPTFRKRRRQSADPSVTAATMLFSLILLCTRFCHSFVISPNAITTTSSFSSALFNAKESGNEEAKKIEWDGEVVEGAHDAEFDDGDNSDAFMPSMEFMEVVGSVASPVVDAAVGSGSKPEFDQLANMGKIHRMELELEKGNAPMTEEDLVAMGGDPAFLFPEDEKVDMSAADDILDMGGDPSFLDGDFTVPAEFSWDGEVNEDAHLD